jgi:hypothetical protein
MRSVLLWLVVFFGTVFVAATPASAAPCRPAELFVTDNTDPLSEAQADATMAQDGATPTGSTPLDGVYWSNALQQASYERSRISSLRRRARIAHRRRSAARPVPPRIGAVLRLSAAERARGERDPHHGADVDIARFGDALVADPTARNRVPRRIRHHHRSHLDPGGGQRRSRGCPPSRRRGRWQLEYGHDCLRQKGIRGVTIPTRWCRAVYW